MPRLSGLSRLVLLYDDAAGLRRGFQFGLWLTASGGVQGEPEFRPVRWSQVEQREDLLPLFAHKRDSTLFVIAAEADAAKLAGLEAILPRLVGLDRTRNRGLIWFSAGERVGLPAGELRMLVRKIRDRFGLGMFHAWPMHEQDQRCLLDCRIESLSRGPAGSGRATPLGPSR